MQRIIYLLMIDLVIHEKVQGIIQRKVVDFRTYNEKDSENSLRQIFNLNSLSVKNYNLQLKMYQKISEKSNIFYSRIQSSRRSSNIFSPFQSI